MLQSFAISSYCMAFESGAISHWKGSLFHQEYQRGKAQLSEAAGSHIQVSPHLTFTCLIMAQPQTTSQDIEPQQHLSISRTHYYTEFKQLVAANYLGNLIALKTRLTFSQA